MNLTWLIMSNARYIRAACEGLRQSGFTVALVNVLAYRCHLVFLVLPPHFFRGV